MDNPEYTAARINEALAGIRRDVEVYWNGDDESIAFDVFVDGDDSNFSVADTGYSLIVYERVGHCDYTVAEVRHYIEVARALAGAAPAYLKEAA